RGQRRPARTARVPERGPLPRGRLQAGPLDRRRLLAADAAGVLTATPIHGASQRNQRGRQARANATASAAPARAITQTSAAMLAWSAARASRRPTTSAVPPSTRSRRAAPGASALPQAW